MEDETRIALLGIIVEDAGDGETERYLTNTAAG